MTNPSPAQWIGNAGDPVNGDWSDAADWTSDGLTPLGYVPGADNAVVSKTAQLPMTPRMKSGRFPAAFST